MNKVSQKTFILLIRGYQRILSPDRGVLGRIFVLRGVCTMYPTCSEYMILAVEKHGVIKGAAKGLLRIGRCHPYQKKLVDFP